MPFAIIDLGSNTFQLLIAEFRDEHPHILHDESRVAKIAKGGISDGIISEAGIIRALETLAYFKTITTKYQVPITSIKAFGTSAIRSAKNKNELLNRIFDQTGIVVDVIEGGQEAQYIYEGVRFAGALGLETSLVMDIGGGSVEFILCNKKRIFWKQSFEIGGQRLMDKFMTEDPIAPQQISKLYHYFDEQLLDLTNAVHQYQPENLIGCAGSFETLVDIDFAKRGVQIESNQVLFDLQISSFRASHLQLITGDRNARLALPGMKAFRADMIVVGVCLIDYILKKHSIDQIKVSNYALKEGVLANIKTFN